MMTGNQNGPKVIYGKRVVLEEIASNNVEKVILKKGLSKQKADKILQSCKSKKIPFRFASKEELDKIISEVNHQGIVAILKETTNKAKTFNSVKEFFEQEQIGDVCLFLVLDSITDTRNFGAILRSCDFFGLKAVIVSKNKSAPITDAVFKTSSGAVNNINIIKVVNIARTLEELKEKGFWIYGTSIDAETSLFKTEFDNKSVIVLGSEGEGIRHLVSKKCDFLISLPKQGKVESLNVSVFAGICLYEFNRQKT